MYQQQPAVLLLVAVLAGSGAICLGQDKIVGAGEPKPKIKHSFLACGQETFIVDGDGKVTWKYLRSSRDGWVLPTGNVLLALSKSKDYPGGAAVEVMREGKVVWEVKTPHWPFTAIRLDNGNTLIGCTLGNLVIEVDATGKTVWQVSN